ncbi:urea carboxylase [Verrucomicrobiota bacterium sgz303538]
MFSKVLIANRGEIACRVIRTLRKLGIASVAVYSEADAHAAHVLAADESVCIGPAAARESYLNVERILEVIRETGAQAVHPGYGFLSENAGFADACEAAGVAFIGPTGEQMRQFGLKHTSRELAKVNGVPLLPGTGLLSSAEEAQREAERIGYPVMLKSTAGGGGIGMQLCRTHEELADRFETVRNLGRNNFKDDGLYLEKFVEVARHIEVQIFGDGQGNVIALGERDCSTQRRNQKVIEETSAPDLTEQQRQELCAAAVRLGKAVGYRSAGTVEFVYDAREGKFYFLEVNTRLQVEHGVTELVTGLDLVEWMVRTAAGDPPDLLAYKHQPQGHSIQVRIYAEDPGKQFQPSSGRLTEVHFPADARCDHWIEAGTEVSPFYDPLVAKLLVHGESRQDAIAKLSKALAETRVEGIETNRDYLRQVIASAEFQCGEVSTGFLKTFDFVPRTIDVLDGGTQTTVQDYPARLGYWAVGVPPSGPMDALAFRLGNRILGNAGRAAGLEMTMTGATLRFNTPAIICLTGAPMRARLGAHPILYWRAVRVEAGQTLVMGAVEGAGCRTYLTVLGGLDVPEYLGSRSTFTLGQFGGHAGRALRVGDVLKLNEPTPDKASVKATTPLPADLIPAYTNTWEIGVLYGPHGAPDFFTPEDIEMFFGTEWKVHHNSARTGVRLVGPKPKWARKDGGEAGLHPSNIHDNAYAIGAVDFTGDMPIILGPDGPSLGGFVCPACIVQGELWKMGQLRPGDRVRFRRISEQEATALEQAQEDEVETFMPQRRAIEATPVPQSLDAVLARLPAEGDRPEVAYRGAGDKYLLVEYGPLALDLNLRFRVHALMTWVEQQKLLGVIDLTPGIRSLQIHYNSRELSRAKLLSTLQRAESELPDIDAMEVPTRIVHLPLSWDDPATRVAIEKYMTGVRPDAPWCPSNIEFIRRINGLASIEEVKEIVFGANYLVMGLGDVYLGAPVAVPLDPRHRLVTTKYNPARTWTPENAVGIGGAYLCVYGMEGPGGYQFVGRTIQMWNRYKVTADFAPGKPWLLRFFDQIRFYPVSSEELLKLREDFVQGRFKLRVEEKTFRLRDYHTFLREIAPEAAACKARQQAAFEAERERWAAAGLDAVPVEDDSVETGGSELDLPPGVSAARAPMPSNVWQVLVKPGDRVEEGDKLVILEAMKMEIPITASGSGIVKDVLCGPGKLVSPGQALCLLAQDL